VRAGPGADGGRVQHVEQFKTTVGGLLVLADWLKAHAVTHVVMEATGDYWKPVWHLLEHDFELMLVNARDVKQVPGRKTDVSDSAWLCQLAEAGLLRASFVPPKPIRDLRLLTRYRRAQIAERKREAQRLHKALEETGIKLDCVATDILGRSGRAMLDALIAGTTDPELLAELARGKLRAKIPALKEALEGRFEPLHALLIGAILAHLDFLDEQIERLTEAIGAQIAPFERAVELLCTIPGVQRRTAEVIVAEIGIDMSGSRRPGTWPPGPVNAPATTNRPASAAAAAPARAPSTSTPRSRTPPWRPCAPTTATCKRSTGARNPSWDTAARSARSSTR
jgi:transposase